MSILDNSASAGGSILDPIAAKIKNPFSTTVGNGGRRPADFPGGFQIVEFVNGVPQESNAIKLLGNMMPMQPFTWSGEQRITKDYYPGNPEAVGHIMGSKEGDLVIHGRFKDKRYRDNKYYGVAYQYAKACDEIRKKGNLVRFGMHGPGGEWIRYGFLEFAEFKMNKLSWVDYELRFFVVSETQPKNNYFAADEKQSPSSVNSNLINSAAAFQASYSAAPKTMPQSIAGLINNITNGVAKNINLVTNFVGTVISTAGDISASAKRALGLIKNARATISKMNRDIGKITHTFSNFSVSGNPAQKAIDIVTGITYISEAQRSTVPLSIYLAKMQAQFENIARTLPKARYKVTQGDTIQNIAVKFYGNADKWSAIYDHNLLQSTALTPGKVLEIPNV